MPLSPTLIVMAITQIMHVRNWSINTDDNQVYVHTSKHPIHVVFNMDKPCILLLRVIKAIHLFQCIVFTVGDEGFSTEPDYDYVIFEDSNNGSGMFTNLINSKQNYTISLSLKRMPFTGVDILYTHNIEAKKNNIETF